MIIVICVWLNGVVYVRYLCKLIDWCMLLFDIGSCVELGVVNNR